MRNGSIKGKKSVAVWIMFLALASWPAFADEYGAGVKGEVLVKSMSTSNGQKLAYLKTENAEVTAMTVEIAPGRETGWHLHTMPVYAYIIEGKLAVETEGGKRYEFSKGQAIIEVVNIPHNGINIGNVPVRLIAFYTGEKDMPIVKKPEKPAK